MLKFLGTKILTPSSFKEDQRCMVVQRFFYTQLIKVTEHNLYGFEEKSLLKKLFRN